MIEDVEYRDAVEGLARERQRGGLAQDAPGRTPIEHRLRVIETDPGTVREVARELSLAAAHVEHPGESLGDEAAGDNFVYVWYRCVAADHPARETHGAGILIVVGGDGLRRHARRHLKRAWRTRRSPPAAAPPACAYSKCSTARARQSCPRALAPSRSRSVPRHREPPARHP